MPGAGSSKCHGTSNFIFSDGPQNGQDVHFFACPAKFLSETVTYVFIECPKLDSHTFFLECMFMPALVIVVVPWPCFY